MRKTAGKTGKSFETPRKLGRRLVALGLCLCMTAAALPAGAAELPVQSEAVSSTSTSAPRGESNSAAGSAANDAASNLTGSAASPSGAAGESKAQADEQAGKTKQPATLQSARAQARASTATGGGIGGPIAGIPQITGTTTGNVSVLDGVNYKEFTLTAYDENNKDSATTSWVTGTVTVSGTAGLGDISYTIPEKVQRTYVSGEVTNSIGVDPGAGTYCVFTVTAVSPGAFKSWTGSRFTLPKTIETIGGLAFCNAAAGVDVSQLSPAALAKAGAGAFAGTTVYVANDAQAAAIPPKALAPQNGEGSYTGRIVKKTDEELKPIEGTAETAQIVPVAAAPENGNIPGFTLQYKDENSQWQDTLADGKAYVVYINEQPVPLWALNRTTYVAGTTNGATWHCAVEAKADTSDGAEVAITVTNCGSTAVPQFSLAIAGENLATGGSGVLINTPVLQENSSTVQHKVLVNTSYSDYDKLENTKKYHLLFGGNDTLYLYKGTSPVINYIWRDNSCAGGEARTADYNATNAAPRSVLACVGTTNISGSNIVGRQLGANESASLSIALNKVGGSGGDQPPVEVEPESVSVSPATLSLAVGGTQRLTAAVSPANAPQGVTWSSSDESVATVSEDGTVTGVKEGTAVITAASTKNAALSAGCTLTVADPLKAAKEKADAALKENKVLPHGSGADKVLELVKSTIGDDRITVEWQNTPTVKEPTISDYGEIEGTLVLSMSGYGSTKTVTVYNYISRETAITLLVNGATPLGDSTLEKAITYSMEWWNITQVEVMGGKFTAADWDFLANWDAKANGNPTNLTSFSISPAVTEVAPMPDRTSAEGALFPSTIESVSVPQVTAVGDYALYRRAGLTSANFPHAAVIGEGAFSGCSNLTALALPKVTTIGAEALKNNIASLSLPAAPPTVTGGYSTFGSAPQTRKLIFVDANGNELVSDALAQAIANYQNDTAACNPDKTRWWGWLNGGEAVDTTLEDAKMRVEEAVKDYKPANSSIAGQILTDMQAAADSDGEKGKVTVSWKAGSPTITPATLEAAGSIAGTLVLTYGDKTQEIEAKWALAKLERSITIKTSTGALKEYKGKNLEAAITALGYKPSTLVVTEGQFLKEDWLYCQNLTTTKTFEIKEGVLVEDIPDSEAGGAEPVSIFPQGYDSKLKSVTVPQAIAIGDGAFANNKNLETVNMPNATQVGAKAFYGCRSITTIQMNQVPAVGDDAFGECINLATVSMENAVTIGARAFASRNDTMKLSAIDFPAAATIGERAFFGCALLEKVNGHDREIYFEKLTTVGDRAFYQEMGNYNKIKTITLPQVETLGERAFYAYYQLTEATLPQLKTIGYQALADCVVLRDLNLPATPPAVELKAGNAGDAFYSCPVDRWISPVDENGKKLTGDALLAAYQSYQKAADGDTVDRLWYGWGMPSETGGKITIRADGTEASGTSLANALNSAGYADATAAQIKTLEVVKGRFSAADWGTVKRTLSKLTTFVIAEGVAPGPIPEEKSGSIIDPSGFLTSSSLKMVELHGITEVPDYTFSKADIETALLPDVRGIGVSAFSRCPLKTVSIPQAVSVGEKAFLETKLQTLELPKAATVGSYACQDCAALTRVEAPALTSVGGGAFWGCTALAEYDLPAVTELGGSAFKGCSKLTEVNFPYVTVLNGSMFESCSALKTVTLPNITAVGEYAFRYCNGLETLELPEVKTVGQEAFYQCKALKNISLPKAESLGEQAFYWCTALESISAPNAKTLGRETFAGCQALTALWLPNVTEIGEGGIRSCTKLTALTLGTTPPAVGENAFYCDPSVMPDGRTVTPAGADGAALTGDALQTAVEAYLAAEDGDTTDDVWYGWKVAGAAAVSLRFSRQPEAAQVLSGEAHTFTALALASNGAPVSYEWHVQAAGSDETQPGGGGSLTLAKTNDGMGPQDEYTVWCVARAAGVTDAESNKVTLTVLRASTVTGTVEDKSGTLVPGAAVTITDGGGKEYGPATTDQNGKWTIPSVPDGEYTVTVEFPNGSKTEQPGVQIPGDGGGADVGTIVKPVSIELSGTVKDYKSAPVQGATVTVTNDATFKTYGPAATDEQGEWAIKDVPAGSYTIKVKLPNGGETLTLKIKVTEEGKVTDREDNALDNLNVQQPAPTISFTTQPKNASVLSGKSCTFTALAQASNGAAVSYEWHIQAARGDDEILTGNGSSVTVTKTSLGTAAEDTYTVWCVAKAEDLADCRSGEVTLTVRRTGTITGTVQDETGAPVKDAEVTVKDEAGQSAGSAATDENGKWTIPDVPDGEYTVTVEFPNGSTVEKPNVTVPGADGGTVDIGTLQKPAAAAIAGTVADHKGNPLAGATVELAKAGSASAYKTAAAGQSGAWSIADVPQGSYTLTASAAGSTDHATGTVTVDAQGKVTGDTALKMPAPTLRFTAHPQNASALSGESHTFSAEARASNGTQVSCQWYLADLDGANQEDLGAGGSVTVTKTITEAEKQYKVWCVASADGAVTVKSAEATLTVRQPGEGAITFTRQPAGGSVRSGGSYTFSAEAQASNGAQVSYNWYLAGHAPGDREYTEAVPQHLGSGANVTLDEKNTGTNANYTYTVWCVASAAGAQDTPSDKAALRVLRTSTAGGTVTDENGQPVKDAEVTMKDENGQAAGSGTTDENGAWTIPDVPDGKYDVVVEFPNGGGEVTKPGVTVPMEGGGTGGDVIKPGQGGFNITGQPQDVTVAKNGPARFAVQVTAVTGVQLTYQWYRNTQNLNQGGTPIGGAAGAVYEPGTDAPGVSYYYCVVSANGKSESSAPAALTVRDIAPKPTAAPSGGQGEDPVPTAVPTPAPTPAPTKGPGTKPTSRPTAAPGGDESEGGGGGKNGGSQGPNGGQAPGTAGGLSGGSDGTVPGKLEGGVIVLAPAGGQSGGAGSTDENGDSQSGASQNGTGTGDKTLVKTHSRLVAEVGQGSVIVTVSEFEGRRMAAVGDTQGLINAALTPEQKQQVDAGETIELRLDVKQLEGGAPGADRALIEQALREPSGSLPALTLGAYLDISLYMRVGKSDWSPVPATDGEVQIVMDLPEELRGLQADFYILRAHGGASDLLPDEDQEPATVTIHTGRFSTYAIAYLLRKTGCGLCGMCPAPLGVCVFLWLLLAAVLAAGGACLWYFVRKKRG